MACIKSAPRSALAAFAPDAPYLAAGTMAGAVDLSFSSSANLEIFKLDFQSEAQELPVVGACPSSERFNRLSWGRPGFASEEYSFGLVAGGLCDGSIGVWNPLKLISSDSPDNPFVARLEKHTGPVRGLEFSAHAPNMLASGADEGQLCIWDLVNPTEPNLFPPLKSVGSGAQTEVSFVSWNPKFQHILASTSYNGISVVWDLRQQKPVTSFSDSSRRRCSVLQWNPDISTQLILSSDDDSSPSLRVWDVRKTISPLREFVGHTKGVIAMSWCPNDSGFLLTCAKDNRTICWDTVTGEAVCELPASNNWNFDIHWYPKFPGVISASSFDVKIGIYNIEACSRLVVGEGEFGAPAKLRAPKWLKRPAGASFGFGGKLVSFHLSPSTLGASSCTSQVYVHNLVTEHSLVSRSTDFQAAMQNGEKTSLQALCNKKSQDSESEDDREIWGFLKVMFEEEGTARTKLLAHLGFSVPNEVSLNALDDLGKLTCTLSLDEQTTNKGGLMEGGEGSAFTMDHGEEFFSNPQPSGDSLVAEEVNSSNGKQVLAGPEEHQESSDSSFDENIQRALVVGDYKGAVLQCISANRMADALVIAHVGSPSLWESTCDQYLKKSHLPYLKIVSAMASNDLMSLVNTRPLSLWKETLALLCTFAQRDEWTALCDKLATRLLTGGNTLAATLCYICAGNVDRTVEIWSCNLKAEQEGKTYVDLLQDLMEKTIVLVFATGHKRVSASLSKLVESYAELLASQGLLATAMEYLKLLGSDESSHELAILRDRIALSDEGDRETKCYPYESSVRQVNSMYGAEQSSFRSVDSSQHYYQDKLQSQQQQSIPGSPYGQGYQQSFGSSYMVYQPTQQTQQFQEYINPVPFQPAQSPQMFLPSQAPQVPKPSLAPPPVSTQPAVKPFVPAAPPPMRNVEQYQQPTLGAQLYSGVASLAYQSVPPEPGSSQAANFPGNKFAQVMAPNPAPGSFMPVTTPGFVPRPSASPVQPSSPAQPSQVQPAAAPPAPPPTVQTVDTSNVTAELRPVVTTLTRLFNETSEALGGSRANPSKKREIEDNSRKIGSLFAKLNSGDLSPNVASKLRQLCQALDSGDFVGALQIQVQLTTSDWEECNFWLGSVKRMIKTRQAVRLK